MGIDLSSPQTQAVAQLLGTLIAIATAVYSLVTAQRNNKKTEAEARKIDAEREEVLSDIALRLVEPLEKKVAKLEKSLAECEVAMEGRVKTLLVGIRKLVKQLRENGIEPIWEPKDE